MLSEEEAAKIERVNEILKIILEKMTMTKAKLEAIITIENASIHPKKALLEIASEALKLVSDGEGDMPRSLGVDGSRRKCEVHDYLLPDGKCNC